MTEKKIRANVRANKFYGNDGTEGWALRIEDFDSRQRIVEVTMTDADMGVMLGGSQVTTVASYWPSESIGMRLEVRTIMVPLFGQDWGSPDAIHDRMAVANAEMEDLGFSALDGWIAVTRDLKQWNSHRQSGDGYLVDIRRHVEIEEGD